MMKTLALLILLPTLAFADDKLPTEISETDSLKFQLAQTQLQLAKTAAHDAETTFNAYRKQLATTYKIDTDAGDDIDFGSRKIVRGTKKKEAVKPVAPLKK